MARMPQEPEAFAEQVSFILGRLMPEHSIDQVGVAELIIDGRRLDLENLQRLVKNDPERGTEIVERYLEQLFAGDAMAINTVSFDFARPRIMPRIQPSSIFDHLDREQVAHIPYVNDTVAVFVIDMPQMTVSVTTEQIVRWGVCTEELESIARQNLTGYAPRLETQLIQSKEGGRAAIISEQDGYDAARLMLPSLHAKLAAQLGGDFYVAVPARDMFVAFSDGPSEFASRIHERVAEDYDRLPYPITDRFFYVTQDGVAGTPMQIDEGRSEAA